jgi:hypothetical protein
LESGRYDLIRVTELFEAEAIWANINTLLDDYTAVKLLNFSNAGTIAGNAGFLSFTS